MSPITTTSATASRRRPTRHSVAVVLLTTGLLTVGFAGPSLADDDVASPTLQECETSFASSGEVSEECEPFRDRLDPAEVSSAQALPALPVASATISLPALPTPAVPTPTVPTPTVPTPSAPTPTVPTPTAPTPTVPTPTVPTPTVPTPTVPTPTVPTAPTPTRPSTGGGADGGAGGGFGGQGGTPEGTIAGGAVSPETVTSCAGSIVCSTTPQAAPRASGLPDTGAPDDLGLLGAGLGLVLGGMYLLRPRRGAGRPGRHRLVA